MRAPFPPRVALRAASDRVGGRSGACSTAYVRPTRGQLFATRCHACDERAQLLRGEMRRLYRDLRALLREGSLDVQEACGRRWAYSGGQQESWVAR